MANGETGLIVSAGVNRCFWCGDKPDYVAYHDATWGMPQDRVRAPPVRENLPGRFSVRPVLADDPTQARQLSRGIDGFDFTKVANYGDAEIEQLVNDAGIVRHRGKIVSTINNANRALEMVEAEGSLGAWFWAWADQGKGGPPAALDAESLMALDFRPNYYSHVEGAEARLVLRRADHLLRLHAGHGLVNGISKAARR